MIMDYFYSKLAEKMSDLILAIVAIGILVVSVEYVQYVIDIPDALRRADFWKRVMLTVIVITFTSYYFIAYASYFSRSHEDQPMGAVGPHRTVAMFLLDLVQVMLTAWLYAVLLIGNLTSAGEGAEVNCLTVKFSLLGLIFVFMTIWHVTVLCWYVASRGAWRDKILHVAFTSTYLLLAVSAYVAQAHSAPVGLQWLFISAYFLCVVLIYHLKAIPDIKRAIRTCVNRSES